jgi:hypothetical protein
LCGSNWRHRQAHRDDQTRNQPICFTHDDLLFGIQGAGVVAGASGAGVVVSGAAAGADEGASVFAGSDAFSSLFWSEQPAAIVAAVESTSKAAIFLIVAIRVSLSFSFLIPGLRIYRARYHLKTGEIAQLATP